MTLPPYLVLSGKLIAFRATELRHAKPCNDAAQIVAAMLGSNDNPVMWT
jgi:hypothetical protein